MKKYKLLLSSLLLAGAMITTTGCRDEFAETNSMKDAVTTGEPTYLFAQAVLELEPYSYQYWFFNAVDFYNCTQMSVPTGSTTESVIEGSSQQGYRCIDILKYLNSVKYERSLMDATTSASFENVEAALNVLAIYMGIYDSDFCGDIPYTQAAMGHLNGTLTPKYDHVEDLYTLWLSQLDAAINSFTTATNQTALGKQDIIYKGDWNKWAKLANSIKLKIAARLISQNFDLAKSIAAEVVAAPCGVLDGVNDDMLFHKADTHTDQSDYVYHWDNTVLTGTAPAKNVVDFLIKNQDPRVRFFYTKNNWNSKIVDIFLAADRKDDIPAYILDNMETKIVDGKEVFRNWTGLGEPWVRYYGLPDTFNAHVDVANYGDWFDYTNQCKFDANHTYRPYSMFQGELLRGRVDFTLPVAPKGPVIEDTNDNPWYGIYLTTAEVNLYLAEFALYGAEGLQDASVYFKKAVEASVKEYDRLCALNKVPYYGTNYGYDEHEEVIDLKAGEVEKLLTQADYQLTGNKADDLEKVYLQQLLHFTLQPHEQFVTGRRSGCPKFGSKLIARTDYSEHQMPAEYYPRRTSVTAPLKTDLMYQIKVDAYEYQGFSTTPGKGILNAERVWQDKGAPQWGEGPILK